MAGKWTDEQAAIIKAVQDGESLMAEALAGVGKTSTLVEATKGRRGLLCAFNVSIRDELLPRVGTEMTVRTIHQLGSAAISKAAKGRPEVYGQKYRKLALAWLETKRRITEREDQRSLADKIKSMVDMVRLDLLEKPDDDDQLLALARDREIDLGSAQDRRVVLDAIAPVLEMGKTMMRSQIDFTDMLYLPVKMGLDVQQFPLVGVDEAQDLSAAQLALTRMATMPFGQRVYIGDRNQAIYAFAGADANSFQNIVDELGGKVYPMTISWRSPKVLAEMAREHVPSFRVPDEAASGRYERMDRDALLRYAQPGMRVMCRVTAELVEFAFGLLMMGTPAFVLGRDIAGKLKSIVDDTARQKGFEMSHFEQYLDAYHVEAASAYDADDEKSAAALEALADRVRCVRVIWARSGRPGSVAALKAAIDALIPENARPEEMVECATIHKNKGRENHCYMRLRPDLIPHPMARTEVQRQQERNLAYVSLTRAKDRLIDEEC